MLLVLLATLCTAKKREKELERQRADEAAHAAEAARADAAPSEQRGSSANSGRGVDLGDLDE